MNDLFRTICLINQTRWNLK